jgi:uncharacterized protein YciI
MKFAALIEYLPDPEKIASARPIHRQYLQGLLKKGQLAVAGPFTDDSGAMIVYETETLQQAEELLKGDPFHAAGVFRRWHLRPWKVVFTNRDLFPAG